MKVFIIKFRFENYLPFTTSVISKNYESALNKAEATIPASIRKEIIMFEEVAGSPKELVKK